MGAEITPADRPSRLPILIHLLVLLLLVCAFASGGLTWLAQIYYDPEVEKQILDEHFWRTFHGILNPFLCIIFGFLLCEHIRYGWKFRANWISGFSMEAVFAALILTGVGLYYAPEAWREAIDTTHKWIGLLLPVTLIWHWIASRMWIKRLKSS